jgi:citrate synthase
MRYRSADLTGLAQRHAGAHRPSAAASTTLDCGLPVLPSALTLIERGRFFYRGHDVLALAETAALEDVAALLWAGAPIEA